jgi:hypothetical protein
MSSRKFRHAERIIAREDGPASFSGRTGTIVDFKGRGGYGVRFDDKPDVTEYLNSTWLDLLPVTTDRLSDTPQRNLPT